MKMLEFCLDLVIILINTFWLHARLGAAMAYAKLRQTSNCTLSTPFVLCKAPKDNVTDRLKSEGGSFCKRTVPKPPRCLN